VSGYSLPRPISESDDAATFDSGEPTLDDYLRTRALNNHVGGASRCFVTCQDGRIVGYYALASGAVSHADWSGKFRRNMPSPIPVILLSRLAIDRKHQGCGLGENLLRDAIARSVQVAEHIGVRAILAHALHDEARRIYARYQFEPSPTDPLHPMLLIKDAKASVAGLHGEVTAEARTMTATLSRRSQRS
jgi:GNAT superfamily N-acetyltransferase